MLQSKHLGYQNGLKKNPSTHCLQEIHYRPNDTGKLKVRGQRTIYHDNRHQKKVISDKLDFK